MRRTSNMFCFSRCVGWFVINCHTQIVWRHRLMSVTLPTGFRPIEVTREETSSPTSGGRSRHSVPKTNRFWWFRTTRMQPYMNPKEENTGCCWVSVCMFTSMRPQGDRRIKTSKSCVLMGAGAELLLSPPQTFQSTFKSQFWECRNTGNDDSIKKTQTSNKTLKDNLK